MVEQIRIVEKALGQSTRGNAEEEKKRPASFALALVVEDMRAGEQFTERNLRSIRPGYGLHTRYRDQVLGRGPPGYHTRHSAGLELSWSDHGRTEIRHPCS